MVGPEAPLVAGLADALSAAGVRAFGPSAAAAQLEGSKKFMKVGAWALSVEQLRFSTWAIGGALPLEQLCSSSMQPLPHVVACKAV